MKLVPTHDSVLRQVAATIDAENISQHSATFEEMHDLMTESKGIGLAAPQVGLNLNAFVMNCSGTKRTCINPIILETSTDMEVMEEGCLSFPGLKLSVNRPFWISAVWHDENGVEHKDKLYGLEARVFLHEWDHCQGILFSDRVGKVTLHLAKKKAAKLTARRVK